MLCTTTPMEIFFFQMYVNCKRYYLFFTLLGLLPSSLFRSQPISGDQNFTNDIALFVLFGPKTKETSRHSRYMTTIPEWVHVRSCSKLFVYCFLLLLGKIWCRILNVSLTLSSIECVDTYFSLIKEDGWSLEVGHLYKYES